MSRIALNNLCIRIAYLISLILVSISHDSFAYWYMELEITLDPRNPWVSITGVDSIKILPASNTLKGTPHSPPEYYLVGKSSQHAIAHDSRRPGRRNSFATANRIPTLYAIQVVEGTGYLLRSRLSSAPDKSDFLMVMEVIDQTPAENCSPFFATLYASMYGNIDHSLFNTGQSESSEKVLKALLMHWARKLEGSIKEGWGLSTLSIMWRQVFAEDKITFSTNSNDKDPEPPVALLKEMTLEVKANKQHTPQQKKPYKPPKLDDSLFEDNSSGDDASEDETTPLALAGQPIYQKMPQRSLRRITLKEGSSEEYQEAVAQINNATEQQKVDAQKKDINAKSTLKRLDLERLEVNRKLVGVYLAKQPGAESIVYSGFLQNDAEPARYIAVKQTCCRANDPVSIQRRERLLKYFDHQLQHSNLIPVLHWQRYRDSLITIEPLMYPLELKGPMAMAEIKQFARQMLDVLAYLHSLHYAHLDFKPANVVFRKRKDAPKLFVLTDLSTMRHISLEPEQTQDNQEPLVGTLTFLPPETIDMALKYQAGKAIDTSLIQPFTQDLFGYAISLIALYFGEDLRLAHNRFVSPDNPKVDTLPEYRDMLTTLLNSTYSTESFSSSFLTMQKSLAPHFKALPDFWFMNLLRDVLSYCRQAKHNTASILYKNHFQLNGPGRLTPPLPSHSQLVVPKRNNYPPVVQPLPASGVNSGSNQPVFPTMSRRDYRKPD
ncbi:protein kinase domain-containing protein [Parendozoicomonas haliclonae]|uniref:Protein kinase domain protein n=1 Tax=Parendozoicomonas haliclonae TaxID=1960125 RepID=A0A1X7AIW3_9GAMM|nr:serine/threonine-protein kinase [Parendozoicomonas haliclonae]SMA45894.1 Protein kinase domain protein [Parendozoicomonas haliclonae]